MLDRGSHVHRCGMVDLHRHTQTEGGVNRDGAITRSRTPAVRPTLKAHLGAMATFKSCDRNTCSLITAGRDTQQEDFLFLTW